jgi:paraquat-inducible protein A
LRRLPAPLPLLIACPDCDLLQRPLAHTDRCLTLCARCRGVLRKPGHPAHEGLLALAIAAVMMLGLANASPLATLNVQGQSVETTLHDMITLLWASDMRLLAIVVAFTIVIAPFLELLTVIYLLGFLHFGVRPRFARAAMRFLHGIEEWNMTEVFVLGALVALIKLDDYAEVRYGIALWSLGAVMILLLAIGAVFNEQETWERLERAT